MVDLLQTIIFKCIFLNENVWICVQIPLKCVRCCQVAKNSVLVQAIARRGAGDRPFPETMAEVQDAMWRHKATIGWLAPWDPNKLTDRLQANTFYLIYLFWINISMMFVPCGQIDTKSSLVQEMTWSLLGTSGIHTTSIEIDQLLSWGKIHWHDDAIIWQRFLHYCSWDLCVGNSPHKGTGNAKLLYFLWF